LEQVRLPDLEVIKRYSIAVRREHAPYDEVVAALRADLAQLTGARIVVREGSVASEPLEKPEPESRRAPARATSSRAAPSRGTSSRSTPAKTAARGRKPAAAAKRGTAAKRKR